MKKHNRATSYSSDSDSEFGAVKGNNSTEYYKSLRMRKAFVNANANSIAVEKPKPRPAYVPPNDVYRHNKDLDSGGKYDKPRSVSAEKDNSPYCVTGRNTERLN
jgi:hypothetical protein